MYHEKIDGGYRFFASSPSAMPRSLQVQFSSLQNLTSSSTLPFQTVVKKSGSKLPLFDIRIANPKDAHRFNYTWDFTMGNFRTAKHDDSHIYLVPFEHGTKHIVPQGYHGSFSHSDPGEEFAIDFSMPEGTAIHAARSGLVIKVKEASNRGGSSESYERDGNLITILHEDGSIAEYVHLQKDGALVEIGDKVEAGQKIGLSGNTGRSSGPHLHFHVAIPTAEGKIKTLPTRFLNHDQKPVSLNPGETYYAFHPGKPPFEAVFGKEITNADYNSHQKQIPAENKVSTREEVVDGTILLFVRNGFDVTKEFVLDFTELENLNTSKHVPLTVTVEPQTEQFLLFLRQKDSLKKYRYRTKWEYRNAE